METRNVNDDEEAPKGSQSWLRELWSQKNTTTQTPLARTMSGSRTTLPVFFDRTTSVGSTAFWLKEPHALQHKLRRVRTGNEEAELHVRAALEVAQVRRPGRNRPRRAAVARSSAPAAMVQCRGVREPLSDDTA